ncbi:uncharacterized protein LOC117581393 [Drosophila guanche]|uniref:Uncharacterized protein n=1 Tax=Drosophila guanche TaxID=7266 RepID=A0A3B0JVU7_DROGU|nr:uncharacterized protein LOC117581393 [Drosophila guanche]SPP77859.1 Hypothetical predicted protein [Drosophila guanche]
MMAENSDNLFPKRVSSPPNGKEQTQPPAKNQATESSDATGLLDNLVSGVPPTSYPEQVRVSALNAMVDEWMNTGQRVEDNVLGGATAAGNLPAAAKNEPNGADEGSPMVASQPNDEEVISLISSDEEVTSPISIDEAVTSPISSDEEVTSPISSDEEVISLISSDEEDDCIIIDDEPDDEQQEAAPSSKH